MASRLCHLYQPGVFVDASAAHAAFSGPMLAGVPIEFGIFALTLLGVALFHHHTLKVALIGLGVLVAYKLGFSVFGHGHEAGLGGFVHHLGAEWVTLANLLGLLTGFAILASAFERSHVPALLPRILPDDWKGGFVLLILVFVLSSFLDNIAAAMIGGLTAFLGRTEEAVTLDTPQTTSITERTE